jgi:hypothetical protein
MEAQSIDTGRPHRRGRSARTAASGVEPRGLAMGELDEPVSTPNGAWSSTVAHRVRWDQTNHRPEASASGLSLGAVGSGWCPPPRPELPTPCPHSSVDKSMPVAGSRSLVRFQLGALRRFGRVAESGRRSRPSSGRGKPHPGSSPGTPTPSLPDPRSTGQEDLGRSALTVRLIARLRSSGSKVGSCSRSTSGSWNRPVSYEGTLRRFRSRRTNGMGTSLPARGLGNLCRGLTRCPASRTERLDKP